MLSCVLNHLPKSSSILSNQASFVAAPLLHADRIEHALSLYYKDQEQLAYEPASYEAVKALGSPVAGEQGHFSRLYCPTRSENRRQQKDQGLSKGCPPIQDPSWNSRWGARPVALKGASRYRKHADQWPKWCPHLLRPTPHANLAGKQSQHLTLFSIFSLFSIFFPFSS